MIATVKLDEDPSAIERDGRTVYTARASLVPSGRGLVAIMLPPVPGIALPFRSGDTCLAGIDGGSAYILGVFASSVEHDGHTMLAARAADKDLRLGSGSGSWQPLMAYNDAHAELAAIRSLLRETLLPALATLFGSAVHVQDVPAGAACTTAVATLASFSDGQAIGGVKGRPA